MKDTKSFGFFVFVILVDLRGFVLSRNRTQKLPRAKQPVVKFRRRTEGGEAPRRSTPRRTVRAVGTPADRRDDRRAGPPPCALCTVGCNIGNI